VGKSNNQLVLPVTGSGRSVAEVLDGLVRDAAAGMGWSGQLSAGIEQLKAATQAQSDAVTQNTRAVLQNTIAQAAAGSGSAAGSIGNIFSRVFGSGMGLSPLVSGLVRLFGGGKAEAAAAPIPYTRPAAISFDGTISTSGGSEARVFSPASGNERAGGGQQITIQVQAMDSRSFLDHSEEIARAVRAAMLNSHALNDVVSDL
jgi:hypothetical protein